MALAALQRSVFVPSSRSPRPPRGPVRPAMAGANADVAPSPPLPVKLFATLKTDATAHTPGRTRCGCCVVLLGGKLPSAKVQRRDPRVLHDSCSSQWAFASRNHSKKTAKTSIAGCQKNRRNIVEGQPPHNLQVRSRRQRYVHTRARLPATRPARRHAGAVRSSTTLLIRTALRWSAAACCTQAPPPAPPSQQW